MNVESKTCFGDHVQTKLSFDVMLCMWDTCAYTCVCLVFGASEDNLGVVFRVSSTSDQFQVVMRSFNQGLQTVLVIH